MTTGLKSRNSGKVCSVTWRSRVSSSSENGEGVLLDEKTSIAYNSGMAKRRSKRLTDQIRQAIDDSGLTRYRIAQKTGIDESALAKFYNGHRGLSMEADLTRWIADLNDLP